MKTPTEPTQEVLYGRLAWAAAKRTGLADEIRQSLRAGHSGFAAQLPWLFIWDTDEDGEWLLGTRIEDPRDALAAVARVAAMFGQGGGRFSAHLAPTPSH